MNKTLRDLLAVLLCFCMICSLCGVSLAAVVDDGASVPDAVPPVVDDSGRVDEPLEVPPDVLDTGDAPAPDVPDDIPPDAPDEDEAPPDDAPGEDEAPPDDVPDASPSPDPGAAVPSAPVLVAPVVVPPDVTYVELPEDYVIRSAGLDGLYSIDPQSVLGPVTPAKTSGLKAVLLSILGSYDPIVAEYQYLGNGSSYYSYLREIQPDYVWLASAAIFAILLYCTWRILGGLVCRK